jgi:hypothetical protein
MPSSAKETMLNEYHLRYSDYSAGLFKGSNSACYKLKNERLESITDEHEFI